MTSTKASFDYVECRRLIEEFIPIKEISHESAKEKNRRNGNINTIHVWWARKPLLPSRAAVFSSLVKCPTDLKSRKKINDQLINLCKWESSTDFEKINKARKQILDSFSNEVPKVLDCFAGGGSIPLEAMRLGCDTYSSDLNGVAYVIELCTLLYPFKFQKSNNIFGDNQSNLVANIHKWNKRILESVQIKINEFYPISNGLNPYAFIWCHAIPCKNPSCNKLIPLISNRWLKKSNKDGLGYSIEYNDTKKPLFKITKYIFTDSNKLEGTVRLGSVNCPYCNQTSNKDYVKECFKKEKVQDLPICKVMLDKKERRHFIEIEEKDELIFKETSTKLKELSNKYDYLIPKEKIIENGRYLTPSLYGYDSWYKLFNDRQLLSLLIFLISLENIKKEMKEEGLEEDLIASLITFFAIVFDRLSDRNSILCTWNPFESALSSANTFARQALQMTWDYCETYPIHIWNKAVIRVLQFIERETIIPMKPATVKIENAMKMDYTDEFFDAVIIDPPYYDAVPYSDLSDFFYVWLKRILYDIHPDAFRTPLTDKSREIIQDPFRHGKEGDAIKWFEDSLANAFIEINRILKKDGILVLIFSNTQTSAWEALIKSLLKTNFVVTAAWPLHTERPGRLRAQKSAALASSIFISCRKRLNNEEGYFNEIREELKKTIHKKLDEFWEQGIQGADFFISAIGPAVEVFGKYKKVKRLSGEEVTINELLNEVGKIVTDYSLHQIIHDGHLGNIDNMTRFYVLWRWAYGSLDVPFDDARKLAQFLGTEPEELLGKKGLLSKKGEKVNMLGPWHRKDEHLGEPKNEIRAPIIDVIHKACILWENGNRKILEDFLLNSGYSQEETLWNVAQAISEILPEGHKEKQVLQGLLNTKNTMNKDSLNKQATLESFGGGN